MQSACQISAHVHYARISVLQLEQRTDDIPKQYLSVTHTGSDYCGICIVSCLDLIQTQEPALYLHVVALRHHDLGAYKAIRLQRVLAGARSISSRRGVFQLAKKCAGSCGRQCEYQGHILFRRSVRFTEAVP